MKRGPSTPSSLLLLLFLLGLYMTRGFFGRSSMASVVQGLRSPKDAQERPRFPARAACMVQFLVQSLSRPTDDPHETVRVARADDSRSPMQRESLIRPNPYAESRATSLGSNTSHLSPISHKNLGPYREDKIIALRAALAKASFCKMSNRTFQSDTDIKSRFSTALSLSCCCKGHLHNGTLTSLRRE